MLVREHIMQIKLFWTDNDKCSVEYDFNVNSCDYSRVNPLHECIHGDHIATYFITESLR